MIIETLGHYDTINIDKVGGNENDNTTNKFKFGIS